MDKIQIDLFNSDKEAEFELNIDNSADFDSAEKEDLNTQNNAECYMKSELKSCVDQSETLQDGILNNVESNTDVNHTESIDISINEESSGAGSNLCEILKQIQQESDRGDNSESRNIPNTNENFIDESASAEKFVAMTTEDDENADEFSLDVGTDQKEDEVPVTMVTENTIQIVGVAPDNVETKTENAVEGENAISLEDILNKHKKDEDSSCDSEFDFEMPGNKPSADQKVKDPNSVTANKVEDKSQTVSSQTSSIQSNSASSAIPPKTADNESRHEQGSQGCDQTLTSKNALPSNVPVDAKMVDTSQREISLQTKPEQSSTNTSPSEEGFSEDHLQREPIPLALTRAQDEWENVQSIEAGFGSSSGKAKDGPKTSPMISFYELEEYFSGCEFADVKSKIRISVDRHGFSAFKHLLFGPPRLNRSLAADRDRIFCLAASSLDNSNHYHMRALQTVYRCLTGSRFDCSRFGRHWEEIGFQGTDPATDLRGGGLLGLIHLIHFLRNPKQMNLANDIYKLSLHPTQNFPFCVMGINLSRIALQTLREDSLNKECNKRKEVMGVVNDLYAALFLSLYQTWKSQGKTVCDSGYILKDIEATAKKTPQKLLKNLDEYLDKRKGTTSSTVNLDNLDIGGENFLSVCDSDAGQY